MCTCCALYDAVRWISSRRSETLCTAECISERHTRGTLAAHSRHIRGTLAAHSRGIYPLLDSAPLPPRLLVLNANEPPLFVHPPLFSRPNIVEYVSKRNIIWSSFSISGSFFTHPQPCCSSSNSSDTSAHSAGERFSLAPAVLHCGCSSIPQIDFFDQIVC